MDFYVINDLPDPAFAIILHGGEKDSEGKTVTHFAKVSQSQRSRRNRPPLTDANARISRSNLTDGQKEQAMRHLAAHKKKLGKGCQTTAASQGQANRIKPAAAQQPIRTLTRDKIKLLQHGSSHLKVIV